MKTFMQTLRRPIRTLFGILLIALAVAVLCVCLGQSFAAEETKKALDEIYLSAAFPEQIDEDCVQWLNQYIQEHPDVVKLQSRLGIASAYVPELTADNWTSYIHEPLINASQTYATYNTAMLEILLTKAEIVYYPQSGTEPICIMLSGVVKRAIGLQEGYADPTGYTAKLTLYVENKEALDQLPLTPGERYLVYGVDYTDQDFILRNTLAKNLGNLQYTSPRLPYWSLDRCEIDYAYSPTSYDEETGEAIYSYTTYGLVNGQPVRMERKTTDVNELPRTGVVTRLDYVITHLKREEVSQFRMLKLTLKNYGTMPTVQYSFVEFGVPIVESGDERSYIDENGEKVVISQEEYAQRYAAPSIAHLTGTAEEFLASEEGALWAQALTDVQINNHAFAFVGVDKMQYLENFNSGEIKIIEGRDFTEGELSTGEKVCLISRQLAEANGLTVGDTIHPQFYNPDVSLPYQLKNNVSLPKPLYYFGNTTQLQQAQSYTIVGIYEQNSPHPYVGDNPRGFTCNTIFTPKTSLTSALQTEDSLTYQTVVVYNGKLVEFLLAAVDAGFGRDFHASDSGYSAVSGSLESYQKNSRRAQYVGFAVYGMILLLYLFLYPTQQRKNLYTMKTMGTQRVRQMWHVIAESLLILSIGSLIGGFAGMLMWDSVVEMLTKGSTYAMNIVLPATAFVKITLNQLVLAAILVALISLVVTHGKAMKKNK